MSAGIVHSQATYKIAWWVTFLAIGLATFYDPIYLLLIPGVWLGHFITPDFDVDHPVYNQRKFIQRYWLFGWLWVIYWLPYSRLISHRSFLSHSWPLGTVLRIVYLIGPPIIILINLGYQVKIDPLFFLIFFLGWSIPDWNHLWKDR